MSQYRLPEPNKIANIDATVKKTNIISELYSMKRIIAKGMHANKYKIPIYFNAFFISMLMYYFFVYKIIFFNGN